MSHDEVILSNACQGRRRLDDGHARVPFSPLLRVVAVAEGIGTTRKGGGGSDRLLAHERGANIGGALLLGGSTGEGGGFGLGLEASVLAAVLAAHICEGADGEEDGHAKDDGDDDAGNLEGVLQLHAHVVALVVHRAGQAGGALALGHTGSGARLGGDGAVVGLDGADPRVDGARGVALEVVGLTGQDGRDRDLGEKGGGCGGGRGSAAELVGANPLVAAVDGGTGLEGSIVGRAARGQETLLDVELVRGLDVEETFGQRDVVGTAGVRG